MKKQTLTKYYIYGKHACEAAFLNKSRQIHKIFSTANNSEIIPTKFRSLIEIVDIKEFFRFLPEDSVHQGIAILSSPLENKFLEHAKFSENSTLAILDQITDPHNFGAILRNAAAFGVEGIIIPNDHSPPENGIVAKASSGALETVPIYNVVNISNTMNFLKKSGFWIIGLDGSAKEYISKKALSGKSCLVLGSEGKGLRRLTKENCDVILKIPIDPRMESLNVSVASAIAFYESYKA